MGSLDDLERAAGAKLFVGRVKERALFERFVRAGATARVLHLVGPGGIGKSALLRVAERDARARGVATSFVDARGFAATRDGARSLLDAAGLEPSPKGSRGLRLVLIDTGEALAPIEATLCSEILSRCGVGDRIVIAGRAVPGRSWTSLSTWGTMILSHEVPALSKGEAEELLRRRGVPVTSRRVILDAARGYPLVLALAADPRTQGAIGSAPAEGSVAALVHVLCDTLLAGLTDVQVEALELASLVRTLDEDLLRSALPENAARGTFDWLRSLCIVKADAAGLFLHDVAREAVVTTLRWRRPERFQELFRIGFHHHIRRAAAARSEAAFYRAMLDIGFVVRHIPGLEKGLAAPPEIPWSRRRATTEDVPAMKALIGRYEGRAASRLVGYWFDRQPAAFVVLCDERDVVKAAFCTLTLTGLSRADCAPDPGVVAVVAHAEALLGRAFRANVQLARFMACEGVYQAPSPEMGAVSPISIEPFFRYPDLTLYYSYYADAAAWEPVFTFAGAKLVPEASFELGGRRYDVAVHDRRARPVSSWLLEIAARGMGETSAAPPQTGAVAARPVSDRDVRTALRVVHDLGVLARHCLASTLLVSSGASSVRASSLQRLLLAEIDALRGTSRSDALFHVARLSYVTPAPSQTDAAEALGMAPSTFRRHLRAATARIAASLEARLGTEGAALAGDRASRPRSPRHE